VKSIQIKIIATECQIVFIRVITKLPNSEQSYKGKVKTHNYINRQNQSTQYALDGTIRKQAQMTYKRHEPSYKQLEVSRRTNKDNILRLRIEENKYTIYKYYH
jgi:hypothetical protein